MSISYAVFCLKKKTSCSSSTPPTAPTGHRFLLEQFALRHQLHSFPTRRSSDLADAEPGCEIAAGWRDLGPPSGAVLPEGAQPFAGAVAAPSPLARRVRSEEHTSELQSHVNLVCRLLLEKKNLLQLLDSSHGADRAQVLARAVRAPPPATLFPYTTLFRSCGCRARMRDRRRLARPGPALGRCAAGGRAAVRRSGGCPVPPCAPGEIGRAHV